MKFILIQRYHFQLYCPWRRLSGGDNNSKLIKFSHASKPNVRRAFATRNDEPLPFKPTITHKRWLRQPVSVSKCIRNRSRTVRNEAEQLIAIHFGLLVVVEIVKKTGRLQHRYNEKKAYSEPPKTIKTREKKLHSPCEIIFSIKKPRREFGLSRKIAKINKKL